MSAPTLGKLSTIGLGRFLKSCHTPEKPQIRGPLIVANQRLSPKLHTCNSPTYRKVSNPSTAISTGQVAAEINREHHESSPEKRAKRPGVTAPWTASHPLATHVWRDSMESNGLIDAAEKHLTILRQKQAEQSTYFVRLAFTYGLEVSRIADLSDIPIERVRAILAGN